MNLTDPSTDVKDKNATDNIEEPSKFTKTVSATNNPSKIKPKKINHKQLKKQLKVGRNELCSCGSGKKYKKCCLIKQQEQSKNKLETIKILDNFKESQSTKDKNDKK